MHEASDLAGLDELRDALFEPPAQNDFAIDLELEFLIHVPILTHPGAFLANALTSIIET